MFCVRKQLDITSPTVISPDSFDTSRTFSAQNESLIYLKAKISLL